MLIGASGRASTAPVSGAVESGFAQLAPEEHGTAFNGNTDGWKHELDELVAHLHG